MRSLDDSEATAAILAVDETILAADFSDSALLAVDMSPIKLFDILRPEREETLRKAALSADATHLYEKVLAEVCNVQFLGAVKQLQARLQGNY